MNTHQISGSLATLFKELMYGAPETGAYVLNRGDAGLLRSLDRLPADVASRVHGDGSSVAAHVEHVRYGLSLMNRWAGGENPFADANWAASWDRTEVSDAEWTQLRAALRQEAEAWLGTLGSAREVVDIELNGMIGSIVHLAYHVGAVRQMERSLRGPAAND